MLLYEVQYSYIHFPAVPDKPSVISVTPDRRSLLVMWAYTNPPLNEGAVVSGYHVYLDGQRVQEIPNNAVTMFNITSLTPFTNYTVQVSAYNTRGNGMEQEGPRSDLMTVTTLGDCMFTQMPSQLYYNVVINKCSAWPTSVFQKMVFLYFNIANYQLAVPHPA